ncbi:DUF4058 family protein [Leptolyngbya sp. 7M]|nr:DUF4058 family protein [Leptolyngbya sp. 7M]
MEIDLLRRRTRLFNHSQLPNTAYLVTVTRAQLRVIEIWPINLQNSLPTIPVPLKPSGTDGPLVLTVRWDFASILPTSLRIALETLSKLN